MRRYHPSVVQRVAQGIGDAGGYVRSDAGTDLLTVNEEFTVSVVVARCKPTPSGKYRWLIRLDASLDPDVTIVTRMDPANRLPFDYYVLPSLDFAASNLPDREANGFSLDFYRVDMLDDFYALCARTPYAEAA